MKKRIYEILEVGREDDATSRYFDIFILSLIAANGVALTLETVPTLHAHYETYFFFFEAFSVTVFTIEYLGRVTTCNINPDFSHPVWGRIRFISRPLLIIDLAAILPFYLAFLGVDLRTLRLVRLMRIFRILKLARYIAALNNLGQALKSKMAEIVVSLTIIFVLIFISSTFMYFVEHKSQPQAFSSIPASMWWSVATLTTVGYGDIAPVTSLGKFLASIIAILGIAAIAIPTAILSDAFRELRKKEES